MQRHVVDHRQAAATRSACQVGSSHTVRKTGIPPPRRPSVHKSALEPANPRMDSECASGCPWSTAWGNSPSPGRPTPGVVKQDKSSGGSVDTTKTRLDPRRVGMGSGERPIGATKGKQSDTEVLCQPPPPPAPGPCASMSSGGVGFAAGKPLQRDQLRFTGAEPTKQQHRDRGLCLEERRGCPAASAPPPSPGLCRQPPTRQSLAGSRGGP